MPDSTDTLKGLCVGGPKDGELLSHHGHRFYVIDPAAPIAMFGPSKTYYEHRTFRVRAADNTIEITAQLWVHESLKEPIMQTRAWGNIFAQLFIRR